MYAKRHFLIIVTFLAFHLSSSLTLAQSTINCRTPPQHKGPFSILFDNPQQNCAFDPAGLASLDHIVTCMENAQQTFDLLTNDEFEDARNQIFNQNKNFLNGRNTLTFKDIANLTHPSDVLEQALNTVSPRLSRLTSYADYTDPASYKAQCLAANNSSTVDREACARQFNDTITSSTGTVRENFLATQNSQEAMLTESQRYIITQNRCRAILSAPSSNNPATKEHIYYINNSTSVYDLCLTLPASYNEFKSLDAGRKQAFFSIEGSKALRIAYIVFEVQQRPSLFQLFLQNVADQSTEPPKRTEIFEVPIHGLVESLENSLSTFKVHTTLSDQQETFDRLYRENDNPATQSIVSSNVNQWISEYRLIIDKINRSGQTCDQPTASFAQINGSFAPINTTEGTGISLSFDWFWRLVPEGFRDLIGSTQTTVKGWVLWPAEYEHLAQIYGTDANALFGAWVTTAQNATEQREVNIPQVINNQTSATHDDFPTWRGDEIDRRPCPTGGPTPGPDGLCPIYEQKSAQVQVSNANPQLFLQAPGGNLVQSILRIFNTNLISSHTRDWWGNVTCFFDELDHRVDLGIYGAAASEVSAQYLQYCRLGRNAPSSDTCWSGNTSELVSSAGECGLNLTNFNGYLNAYGINGLPPTAIQIIETAAQANNVPANLIIGLLMTEGSFENSDWNWTENMVRSSSICGGQVPECRPNSAGALGPYQIIPRWHPNFTGDPCNFYDSTMYVAGLLAKYKNGDSADFYALTVGLYGDQSTNNGLTCNEINYYTGGGEASTCTNWDTVNAATTYRFHRGICDIPSQTFFINIFQGNAPQ